MLQARQLEHMPAARGSFEVGTLSLAAMRMLADARAAEPDHFDEAEPVLVKAARCHALPDLRRVVAHWRHVVERDRATSGGGADAGRSARRLHASVTFDGMVRVDGDLDPETGSSLLTAIGAVVEAERRADDVDDDRTAPQRRADALGEICRSFLDRTNRPVVGGERPHLTVTVPLAVLSAPTRPDGGRNTDPLVITELRSLADPGSGADLVSTAELDPSGPIAAPTARRFACDASVTRIVLGPRSEPLDVGRLTPVIPPAINSESLGIGVMADSCNGRLRCRASGIESTLFVAIRLQMRRLDR